MGKGGWGWGVNEGEGGDRNLEFAKEKTTGFQKYLGPIPTADKQKYYSSVAQAHLLPLLPPPPSPPPLHPHD